MVRFISFLLGKPYESCKGCETLKYQLELANYEKKQLLDTILNIVKPQPVISTPVTTQPIHKVASSWTKQRAALEAEDRHRAQIEAKDKLSVELKNRVDILEEELLGEEKGNASEVG